MQLFGIVVLIIMVGLGAYFVGNNSNLVPNNDATPAVVEAPKAEPTDVNIKVENTVTPNGAMVTIYDAVSVAANSQTLALSGKGFTGSLKGEIRLLNDLRELDISGNKFTGVPAEIGQLTKLEVLNLSNNPITGLPHEIGNLKNLRTLDLRGTQYSAQDLVIIKQGLSASTQVLVD
jgi:Leucine-rich repeat (LRR) protein